MQLATLNGPAVTMTSREIAELQRAFIETQARLADMLGRMERLQGVQSFPTLRAA